MGKYNIYAIANGVDPDTHKPVSSLKVDNWPECQKYVKGVPDARYKGFLTDDEADAWLLLKTKEPIIPINSADEFDIFCSSHGLNPYEISKHLKRQFMDTYKLLNI